MDNLDIAANSVSFVVFGYLYYQTIFYEHITILSFRRVLITNA